MPYIIAEAGVNHNGCKQIALELIDIAIDAGVDAVKFQLFKADSLATKKTKMVDYQSRNTFRHITQYDLLKSLELSKDDFFKISDYCKSQHIDLIISPFDSDSLAFIVNELGHKTLKIASGEITNAPLLLQSAHSGCDLLVSTGMSNLDEITDALGVIAFGYLNSELSEIKPSRELFREAFYSSEGQELLKEKITLLHCTSEYPTPYCEINLKAITTLIEEYGLKVGFSDHSEGILAPVVAVSLGAVLIEKHFTLDKSLDGPDHKASLGPLELKEMVDTIRSINEMLGDGQKLATKSEIKNINNIRKSLFASTNVSIGEFFTKNNISVKRPGTGLSPFEYWDVLGQKSLANLKKDDKIII